MKLDETTARECARLVCPLCRGIKGSSYERDVSYVAGHGWLHYYHGIGANLKCEAWPIWAALEKSKEAPTT